MVRVGPSQQLLVSKRLTLLRQALFSNSQSRTLSTASTKVKTAVMEETNLMRLTTQRSILKSSRETTHTRLRVESASGRLLKAKLK